MRNPTKSIRRGLLAFLAMLLVYGAAGTSPAAAQQTCGDTVTILRGDTLNDVARRCGTTVESLLRANPNLNDPTALRVGMTLALTRSAYYETSYQGPLVRRVVDTVVPTATWSRQSVSIRPMEGPPGTVTTVRATGFEAGEEVYLGAGPDVDRYEIIGRARADAYGDVEAEAVIPRDAGASWTFVVVSENQRRMVSATPFAVVDAAPRYRFDDAAQREGTRSYNAGVAPAGNARGTVQLRGRLVKGQDCYFLSTKNGNLYAVVGDRQGFKNNDEVYVEGVPVKADKCHDVKNIQIISIGERR